MGCLGDVLGLSESFKEGCGQTQVACALVGDIEFGLLARNELPSTPSSWEPYEDAQVGTLM